MGHISSNRDNSSQTGYPVSGSLYRDEDNDVNSVYNPAQVREVCETCMSLGNKNAMYKVNSASLEIIYVDD